MTVKVAIITPDVSHFEVPLYRLATAQAELDVHVFHMDHKADSFADPDYAATIDWGERRKSGYANSEHADPAALRRAVLAWAPDVAMFYGYFWPGALALLARLRLAGIPVVQRGLLTPYANSRKSRLVGALWRKVQPLLLRRFQAHHFGGSYSETVLERAGIAAERRYFVPYSIDSDHFAAQADDPGCIAAAAALRARLGWQPDDPVLLFMCQHSWFKAPDAMLEIAAAAQRRHLDLRLIMAGSGHMTEALKAQAARILSPGSYYFPGFVQSKAAMPFYLAADLVLFPSRYDTWSRGVNEAMLARRPCLVSRIVPAAGGLVEHGRNGYVVDGLDADAFAALIDGHLALMPDRRAEMGAAARERAMHFSYGAQIENVRRSFIETAHRHQQRRPERTA